MRRWLVLIGVLLALLPAVVSAATTADVTITATGKSVAITNDPSTHAFGTVEASTTHTTEVDPEVCKYTMTNTGNVTSSVTITAGTMSGDPVSWTLSDTATPGAATYGLKAGLEAAGDIYTVIVKNSSGNTLKSALTASSTQDWGMKLWTPTSGLGTNEVSGTVTLTITED